MSFGINDRMNLADPPRDLSIATAMINAWDRLAIESRATHLADVKQPA
jgi:hypothetical protein